MHLTAVPTFSSFLAELCQRADVSSVSADFHKKPLKLYINSARLLFKTAELYRRNGDLPNAHVLYLKYSNLLVYAFPKHRQYAQYQQQQDLVDLKRNALTAMDALEEIKAKLEPWWEANVKPLIIAQQSSITTLDEETTLDTPTEITESDNKIEDDEDERAEKRRTEIEKFYRQFKDSQFTEAAVPEENIKKDDPIVPIIPKRQCIKSDSIFLTESGMPLRPVRIPFSLIEVFMRIANSNTTNNIETCGVLGGTLESKSNTFSVTHLIVPKQRGTSDTCHMIREEEVAEAAISNSLMTLGWIHTHPTQSCFMSSIDQHTQFPFQALMAEAVAVVVAPRKTPNYGVFRLTDPPGMPTISRCGQSGFHPHPDNMYCELVHQSAIRGHVRMDHSAPLTVIDLR